ncbi:MAG: ribbon-helix-helix protein, CopG family [Promicromonosporaceae bacterium]|nr:ribbon-helix-helix protein, CopG family [Promicromonosporaceae bacterium]
MSDVISVRLGSELGARLARLASLSHRPRSYYVREALDAQLERLEWVAGLERRAEDVRSGRVVARPLDEVFDEMGIPEPTPEELTAIWDEIE